MLGQLLFTGLSMGAVYALVALSFSLIFNAMSIINFSQGETLMLGGMFFVGLAVGWKWPLYVALPLAAVLSGVSGLVVRYVGIRPLRRQNSPLISYIIITLAFSIMFKGGAELAWGTSPRKVPSAVPEHTYHALGIAFSTQQLLIIGVTLAAMVLLALFFSRTNMGKAIRAASYNEDAAWLTGINVKWTVSLIFFLSGLLSGLAGIVIGPLGNANPSMGVLLGLKGFSAAMIGGFGSFYGAFVGGIFLGLIESIFGGYVSTAYAPTVAFVLLLLVLFVRPSGLLGKPEVEKL